MACRKTWVRSREGPAVIDYSRQASPCFVCLNTCAYLCKLLDAEPLLPRLLPHPLCLGLCALLRLHAVENRLAHLACVARSSAAAAAQ